MKIAGAVTLLLFFLTSCVVPASPSPPRIGALLDFSAATKRVEWNGVVVSDSSELDTGIEIFDTDGFHIGATFRGLSDTDTPAEQRELDIGWRWNGPWDTQMDLGLAYTDPHEVGDKLFGFPDYWLLYFTGRQVYETDTGRHRFGPLLELGVRRRADGDPAQGESVALGVWHEWGRDLKRNRRMFFGQDLAVMHDTGSLGFQSITLARYDAALYFPVFNGSARWKLGAGFTSPLSSAEDSQEAESVTTLSYQIFFGRKDLDR